MLLSDALWTRRFARDPRVVGPTLRLDGEPVTIAGILPRDLPLPLTKIDGWIPLALAPGEANSESRMLWVFGRLAPGATTAAADAELSALLRSRTGAGAGQIGARVEPIEEAMRGEVRPDLLLAFGGTAIVLLIASGNAMMLLARGAARQRELAVRIAVGASRVRVVRQLAAESIVLGVAGAAAGLLLAVWTLRALDAMIPPTLREKVVTRVDASVLCFVLSVTFGTVLLFGVGPAFASIRRPSGPMLAAGSRTTERIGARSIRRALVVMEVAFTVLLVSAAVLLGGTFAALLHTDLGFTPAGVLTMEVPRSDRADGAPDRRFCSP